MRKEKKDEEAYLSNPFSGLDKSTVVQEVSTGCILCPIAN